MLLHDFGPYVLVVICLVVAEGALMIAILLPGLAAVPGRAAGCLKRYRYPAMAGMRGIGARRLVRKPVRVLDRR